MDKQTIEQVYENARQKGVYAKDIITAWLDGNLTDDECYSRLIDRCYEAAARLMNIAA